MTNFYGHPTQSIEAGKLRLEYLSDVGPRVARIFYGDNPVSLLAELSSGQTDSEYGTFEFMGGHRLWHSPEAMPRSYVPDQPVTISTQGGVVHIDASPEPPTGIAKSLAITVSAEQPEVVIKHTLSNQSDQVVELAPWAISMCRQGGVGIFPQPQEDNPDSYLLANRHLAIWPYTRINEARLDLADDYILLHAQPELPPVKIGTYNTAGWVAYYIDDILWVKRFETQRVEVYPDNGCNAETYCNDQFMEMETLAPLATLKPGDQAVHVETWHFYEGLQHDFIPEALRQRLQA